MGDIRGEGQGQIVKCGGFFSEVKVIALWGERT